MKESADNIKKYAAHWVLVLSGSIVVLSVALNQIGFRVDRIMDAWSQKIVYESKAKYDLKNCPVPTPSLVLPNTEAVDLTPVMNRLQLLDEISQRVEILESLAHPQGVKS